jgi:cytochrome c553
MLQATLITAAILLGAGCANVERSRDVANPDVAGATLARQVCSMCHGVTGVSPSPNFPNLAAQSKDYVVAQLTEFRSHSRTDPAGFEYMWGISHRLSDAQIQQLADYFAAQAPARHAPDGDADRLELGRLLFKQGAADRGVPACSGCHGDQGQGLAAFPRLAGQHADYVRKQLRVFQRTDQRPEGAIMKTVAHELRPDEIDGAALYVQGLPGPSLP